MTGDSTAVYLAASRALEAARLRFALTGATALGAYTLPRATLDLDILVEPPTRPLDALLPDLMLAERTKDVYFDQDAYIFEVPTHVTPIEMFVASHWLTRAALDRRRSAHVPGLGEVPIVRADDAILLKAAICVHPERAYRRAMDVDDLRRMHDADLDMDMARVKEMAEKLGAPAVAALREAGFDL